MEKAVKSLIFDMDETIADTEEAYRESFNKTMDRFGIKTEKEEWKRFPGTGALYVLSTILRENNVRPKETLEQLLEYWIAEYIKTARKGIQPIKGFMEFNRKINRLGMKKIIASGSPRSNVLLVLKSFGLEKEFQIIGGDEIENRKPNPEIFLKAAERINSKPEDCIVFEDSLPGIMAAKRAGMKCVALLTSFPRPALERENPDLIIKDYTGLDPKALLRL